MCKYRHVIETQNISMNVCTHLSKRVNSYMCKSRRVCVCISKYIYVYTHMYIHIYLSLYIICIIIISCAKMHTSIGRFEKRLIRQLFRAGIQALSLSFDLCLCRLHTPWKAGRLEARSCKLLEHLSYSQIHGYQGHTEDGHGWFSIEELYHGACQSPYIGSMSFWLTRNMDRSSYEGELSSGFVSVSMSSWGNDMSVEMWSPRTSTMAGII